ncbi:MAG: DUF86 domain-containing protein [Candidatus Sigynarchaeota archaeon]
MKPPAKSSKPQRQRKPAKGRSVKLYLKDILSAINKIITWTKGMNFEEFSKNDILVDAIVRNLEIIGEAASVLPRNVTSTHSEVQWKQVVGMRDIIAYGYFKVDLNIIWTTISENLPKLHPVIEKMISETE